MCVYLGPLPPYKRTIHYNFRMYFETYNHVSSTEQADASISDFIGGVPRLNIGQHTKKFFLDVSVIQDETITLSKNFGSHPTRTETSRFIKYT